MKKVGIVVLYFGKMPAYFQLFLDSCAENPNFDWVIFTDDQSEYQYPSNVTVEYTSFHEMQCRIQSAFSFPINLETPQKLCDYKCAYGYILEDYLKQFDFWGHCDLDQIFGDLSSFITDDILDRYDKIFSLGHLTLYRNTPDNNRVFMQRLQGEERYKEVFSTPYGCAFDEWLPKNINEIYLASGRPVILENLGADINSYRTVFTLTHFDVKQRAYLLEKRNSIFTWEQGHIYQIYLVKGNLIKREFPYVHLQKRKMSDRRTGNNKLRYCIVPNKFIDYPDDFVRCLRRCTIYNLLNYQYFRVKWKSLLYRIKSGDWKFSNIFK